MAWLADGLLLACITKRGSLVILPRFGHPLKLVTRGHSSDMGPATFLPVHPLITVKGHHQPEHSQSSEADVLRQRFSVTAHPLHPVLLCSDGYSFTILRLLTRAPLSQLVTGLVLDARKKLCLSPSCAPLVPEDNSTPRSSLDHGDVHDFAATLTDLEATGLSDTLGDTLLSSIGSGEGLFGSLETGAVHFAGMDSDLDQTQSLLMTSENIKKTSLEVATFQLRSALGLLLSCGKLECGNGVYPQLQPLQQGEVEKMQFETRQACRLLLSTFLVMVESSVVASKAEANSGDHLEGLFNELFGDVLGLVPLDSFNQSHLELVSALINGSLLTVLKSSLLKHKEFVLLSRGQPTIQLLKEFSDGVFEDVSAVSELLESSVCVLDSTYGMRPLFGADSAFQIPLHPSKKHRRHHDSNTASHLSVSLTNMLELFGVFWQDIQACSDIANETVSSINSSSPQHSKVQLRELGILCKGLAGSLQVAMTALKCAHAQVRRLIHGDKNKGMLFELQASLAAPTTLCEQNQNDNPITLSNDENLSLLLSKLRQYDLKGALEIVHSDDVLVCSSSPADGRFDLNMSTATLTNSLSLTRLSLASPSARSVVTCLADIMMAFFGNKKLLISPPTVAKAIHLAIKGGGHTARLFELKRSEIVKAVRDQELSKVWTADCALELALLGGLWEEAVKFVTDLGEWKKAILLSLAYTNHSNLLREKVEVKKNLGCCLESLTDFSHRLSLHSIVNLLGLEVFSNQIAPPGLGKGQPSSYASTCRPQHCSEESFHSIAGTLSVCAAGGMDSVLTKLVSSLVGAVTVSCQRLSQSVHSSVYLPAPPLYCPQPTIPEEVRTRSDA